jgi:hypothetical protein
VARAQEVHGVGRYDYSEVVYRTVKVPVTIVCPRHGPFSQGPSSHLQGTGCPTCSASKGELEVQRVLADAGVVFVPQWRHPTLRCRGSLAVDFAVEARQALIEFDGVFHRHPVQFPGESAEAAHSRFEDIQQRDAIKNDWAAANGWRMVRLTDVKTVEQDLRAAGVIA